MINFSKHLLELRKSTIRLKVKFKCIQRKNASYDNGDLPDEATRLLSKFDSFHPKSKRKYFNGYGFHILEHLAGKKINKCVDTYIGIKFVHMSKNK